MAEKPIKTPLPADLPEDWNIGQIVAPDGTTVGLTEQHGYNYLMAAVNRAQRGVNTLNEAFSDGIGGGFIEMERSIPVDGRKSSTLYGLIVKEYNTKE